MTNEEQNKINKNKILDLLAYFETTLAGIVLMATVVFGGFALMEMIQMDWAQLQTYFRFLEYVLNIAIGIELARLLLDYSLETLVELLAFVIARKLLLIEGDFVSLLLGIAALALLFAARHYFPRTFNNKAAKNSELG